MTSLGKNCPDFQIDTRGGIAGPPAMRGKWYALVHCDRPCMPGCKDCEAKFATLAESLKAYQCHLVVALDASDGTMLITPSSAEASEWTLAHWRGPRTLGAEKVASALIVDPDGKVRAALEIPDSASQNVVLLLDLVRHAQDEDTLVHAAPSGLVREATGCVDWFDFGESPLQ